MTDLPTTFFSAIENGDTARLLSFLAHSPEAAHWTNDEGQTGLMLAAQEGNSSAVEALIGVSSAAATDSNYYTALLLAASHGRTDCLRLLLPHDDPNTLNADGQDALMLAAWGGYVECVRLLLPRSDPTQTDSEGYTALMLACDGGHVACVSALLAGSDLSYTTEAEWNTPLMVAASSARVSCIELLLDHNSALDQDKNGQDVFALALERAQRGYPRQPLSDPWACVDLLAPFVEPHRALAAYQQAPNGSMPRFEAAREREVLGAALASDASASEATTSQWLRPRRV